MDSDFIQDGFQTNKLRLVNYVDLFSAPQMSTLFFRFRSASIETYKDPMILENIYSSFCWHLLRRNALKTFTVEILNYLRNTKKTHDCSSINKCRFNPYQQVSRTLARLIPGKLILATNQIWMSFPEICLAYDHKIKILKKMDYFSHNRFESPLGCPRDSKSSNRK